MVEKNLRKLALDIDEKLKELRKSFISLAKTMDNFSETIDQLIEHKNEISSCGSFLLKYENIPNDIRVEYNELGVTIEEHGSGFVFMSYDQVKEFIQKITPLLK